MKVKIGAVEISDISMDELEQILNRFGHMFSDDDRLAGLENAKSNTNMSIHGVSVSQPKDLVALQRFIDAGATGVPVKELGHILGKQGKAIRGAIQDWARRINLVTDGNIQPWEITRIGTQRGYRLKPALMDVAKMISLKMRPA
ncbi:MAG TPA: hypothetical protein VKJ65_08695 [Phycisphaerae bacterium]|nr:hypothetical protein [Phycisphaerae bacterium]